MTRIAILDYGSGNLRSAERAIARTGADVVVTSDERVATEADGLVVPGVGAFAACMDGLLGVNGDRIIDRRLVAGRPVLGICVGMQILFERGVEHGTEVAGLGQWPGVVDALDAPVLPHMGWNTVTPAAGSRLFAGVESERFYFVHSFGVHAWAFEQRADNVAAPLVTWCDYGAPFIAAIENGPLCATQFHPEKSGDAGARLLRNWVDSVRN
jgi:glutamine amidotransferase